MIAEALLDDVGPVRSDHPMYRSGSPEDAAAAYQREIEALDRLDLVHLGLGPDGHTASLFPDSAALAIDDPAVLVAANRDPNANNPHDRVTLTLPGIARAAAGRLHRVRCCRSGTPSPDCSPVPICPRPGSPPVRCCGWSTPTPPPTPASGSGSGSGAGSGPGLGLGLGLRSRGSGPAA